MSWIPDLPKIVQAGNPRRLCADPFHSLGIGTLPPDREKTPT